MPVCIPALQTHSLQEYEPHCIGLGHHILHMICKHIAHMLLSVNERAVHLHAVGLTRLGMPCTVATGVTTTAILLPSQDYRIGGQIITSRFMIILAAMILWGICEGYGCAA